MVSSEALSSPVLGSCAPASGLGYEDSPAALRAARQVYRITTGPVWRTCIVFAYNLHMNSLHYLFPGNFKLNINCYCPQEFLFFDFAFSVSSHPLAVSDSDPCMEGKEEADASARLEKGS